MSFFLGLSAGSVIGFIIAIFCSMAAWQAPDLSMKMERAEALKRLLMVDGATGPGQDYIRHSENSTVR